MKNKKKLTNVFCAIDFSTEQKISPLISKYKVRVFYTGENRNGSYISKEVGEKLASRLGGVPVVGAFDSVKNDFTDHYGVYRSVAAEGNKSGAAASVYIAPTAYGFVPTNATPFYETHLDKDGVTREYLATEVYLWTGRFPELALLANNENNQSMELDPKTVEGEWVNTNGKELYSITNAEFLGLCILGKDVEPCFEGAGLETMFSSNEEEHAQFAALLSQMKAELQEALSTQEEETEEEEETVEDCGEQVSEEENSDTSEEEVEAEEASDEPVEEAEEVLAEEPVEDFEANAAEEVAEEPVEEPEVEETEESEEEVAETDSQEVPVNNNLQETLDSKEQELADLRNQFAQLQEEYNNLLSSISQDKRSYLSSVEDRLSEENYAAAEASIEDNAETAYSFQMRISADLLPVESGAITYSLEDEKYGATTTNEEEWLVAVKNKQKQLGGLI